MTESENLLKKRLTELSSRCNLNDCYTYSEFLTLSEQDALNNTKLSAPYTLIGGYTGAERKIVRFGDESLYGYNEEAPVCWLCISPIAPKFADKLTHRDFLGSLTGLGIKREVLGDIIVFENQGYLFCLKSISKYIKEELTQVKHTNVRVSYIDAPPYGSTALPDKKQIVISSERLDAIIAAAYNLSRTQSQKLFLQEKVFSNSRLIANTSYLPKCGDIISVRGYGRFIYEGIAGETKKGRFRANVRIF